MNHQTRYTIRIFSLLGSLCLLLATANLQAKQHLAISLKGTSEMPPVITKASGKGKIIVFPNRMVSGSIHSYDLYATRAYIHEAAIGENGPRIMTLNKIANGTFVVPDEARLTKAQYRSYMAGKLYVNVRSVQYPLGEIRAQLPRFRSTARLR